jgi:hypothetical protein
MLELGVMGLLLLPYGLRAEKLVHISEIKPEESGLTVQLRLPVLWRKVAGEAAQD